MRNIAFEMLIYMEKKQIRLSIVIQKRYTKKENKEKKAFYAGINAGRQYERKLLLQLLKEKRKEVKDEIL